MHFTLVDGFSSEGEATLSNGQSLPLPSLVENEMGTTILLITGEDLPVDTVVTAVERGATLIYRPNGSWISMDELVELAVDKPSEGVLSVPEFCWHMGLQKTGSEPQERSEGRQEPLQDFVHLHCHSEFSALDGLATTKEIVQTAVEQGQTAVAVTDHGWVSGHPYLQEDCEEAGIKPIFGMEAYLVNDRFNRESNDYYHLTLWAMTDTGLRNLWAISTEGHRDGTLNPDGSHSGKPRIDWDTLERLNEGVIAGSGCLRGPVAKEKLENQVSRALTNSKKLMDIFGDRYYIEIHTNHLEQQLAVNEWLVKHAHEFDIPLIASVDSHYAHKDERDDHQVWLSAQTGKDVSQESSLFGGGQDFHMMDQEEVARSLQYLGQSVVTESMANTVKLADRCNAKVSKREGMPTFHSGEGAEDKDIELAYDIIAKNWNERTFGKPYTQDEAFARCEREMNVLVPKGFMGYFAMNADLVAYAKDNGVLVGPGRGSGAGSFVAYLMGIVEVDPLEHDLMFERFMTEGRTALPDFDIDYPSSKKQFMIDYAQSRWGRKHVCAVGTIQRMKNKSAFKDPGRAILSRMPDGAWNDIEAICKIVDAAEASTAGLGLKWDQLMDAAGDELEPYREKHGYLFQLAEKFRGRLKTYSKHAAGLILDPQYDLEGSLPMAMSPNGVLVTQFDKDILEFLGYVKFDFLNLRNLDTIQVAVDLISEQLGVRVNPYTWRDEYHDEKVFAELQDGWTLGCFQIETNLGTKTVKQLKPESLADLSDCITLGRPGPIRSGLDRTYFRRREGKEKVTFPDDRLREVLARTYGTMIYQEDIMAVTIALADYTDNEADYVRKILGKKKPEEAAKEGKKFVERATATGTSRLVAESLWGQMAEFALYSFNRAHAFAYATLAYWTAWLKIHYPVQFATAVLSTIEKEEIPDWVSEARRLGFKVLPPDINDSRAGFSNTATTVRYGLDSIKGIGTAATEAITVSQPYSSFDDFMERKGDKCNAGHIKLLAHIGAFDSLVGNRKALELRLAEEDVKPGERCIFFQLQPRNKYNDLPCGFDWDSEPKKLGRSGKPLKTQKQPPKVCSKACRQWTPRPLPDDDSVTPYTDAEIRQIEMETLGIYLSSSPFDIIDEEDRALLMSANQLQTEPAGTYLTAILITRIKDHMTRDGKHMKFLTAETPSGTMDLTIFSDKLSQYGKYIVPGQMALAEVSKNDRGITLQMMEAV